MLSLSSLSALTNLRLLHVFDTGRYMWGAHVQYSQVVVEYNNIAMLI